MFVDVQLLPPDFLPGLHEIWLQAGLQDVSGSVG
jgi:hypothetical protein